MISRCAKIFLCCLLAALANEGLALKLSMSDKSKRIHGGDPVDISERPYMVQLRDSFRDRCDCGGTLVDSTHVVTAAHCLDKLDPVTDLVVVGGANTKYENGVKIKIAASYTHPDYAKGHEWNDDVAILKLASPMVGKNIKPIGMYFEEVENGKFLTVSGWGRTEKGRLPLKEPARTARVEKIAYDVCKEKYVNEGGLTPTMMCAASAGKDACQGDSGGPAIYKDKLAAVVSWGAYCANPDFPGVYTSLKSVKDFVVKTLKK